jgi:dihydroflavonol-4-reductase
MVTIRANDRIVVTGASGFIGSAVVRALTARGAQIVALVEPGADGRNLHDVERIEADIRDPGAVRRAVDGARFVVHLAAVYRFWARDPNLFYQVNVDGTRHVIAAVKDAGCERLVYTSTVGVLSQRGPGPADETSVTRPGDLHGHYKRSKYAAEHEILRAGAEGLDVTLVLPTFPLGPGDLAPTPTGKVIVDYLNGRMPGYAGVSLNVVHVDDLAQGHVAALERGRSGRSYIIGGENMPMRAILEVLAGFAGRQAPTIRVPAGLAVLTGAVSTLIEGRVLHREPRVPFEAARQTAGTMTFSDARARSELGYSSRPAREAILDSAHWFKENGYVNRRA